MSEPLPTSRKQARITGRSRYHTGKPCMRGHISDRYTNDLSCVSCVKERNVYNAEARREGIAAKRALETPEEKVARLSRRTKRVETPEQADQRRLRWNEYFREHRATHLEERRAYMREYMKRYYTEKPEKRQEHKKINNKRLASMTDDERSAYREHRRALYRARADKRRLDAEAKQETSEQSDAA